MPLGINNTNNTYVLSDLSQKNNEHSQISLALLRDKYHLINSRRLRQIMAGNRIPINNLLDDHNAAALSKTTFTSKELRMNSKSALSNCMPKSDSLLVKMPFKQINRHFVEPIRHTPRDLSLRKSDSSGSNSQSDLSSSKFNIEIQVVLFICVFFFFLF
jgi:hypothetical protein